MLYLKIIEERFQEPNKLKAKFSNLCQRKMKVQNKLQNGQTDKKKLKERENKKKEKLKNISLRKSVFNEDMMETNGLKP